MPFAQIVALATIVGLFISKEPKRIPLNAFTILWGVFILWMMLSTAFAIYPQDAFEQLKKVLKIQLVTFLTLMVVNSRQRIDLLVWVIAVSIGFYGVKGGMFTLLTGGSSRVFGPDGSFIAENNSLALATLMVIPLMYYLRAHTNNRWLRLGLLAAMVLCSVSVLGSHSRGAFLAGVAVAIFFWLRSKRKLITALALVVLIPSLLLFMPEQWHERIGTIRQDNKADVVEIESMRTRDGKGFLSAPIPSRDWLGYWPNDFSALGRVNAWNYAINVANARVTGAGFESWSAENFARYAPIVEEVQAAHSIYFSVLADHGWIGLMMFIGILWMAFRNGAWVIARSREHADLAWTGDLSRMIQVSLIAYCMGGAFLSLAYYDLPWHLFAILIVCGQLTERHLRDARSAQGRQQALVGRAFDRRLPDWKRT
jgi:hypothetical protein